MLTMALEASDDVLPQRAAVLADGLSVGAGQVGREGGRQGDGCRKGRGGPTGADACRAVRQPQRGNAEARDAADESGLAHRLRIAGAVEQPDLLVERQLDEDPVGKRVGLGRCTDRHRRPLLALFGRSNGPSRRRRKGHSDGDEGTAGRARHGLSLLSSQGAVKARSTASWR